LRSVDRGAQAARCASVYDQEAAAQALSAEGITALANEIRQVQRAGPMFTYLIEKILKRTEDDYFIAKWRTTVFLTLSAERITALASEIRQVQ